MQSTSLSICPAFTAMSFKVKIKSWYLKRRIGIYEILPLLHEVRLGNCISYKCHLPEDYPEAMLPPLTLQLLVENVIKHNSITSNKPMQINIEIENYYLTVSNPIQPKRVMTPLRE